MTQSDFDALKVSLASPDEIKSWSYGEILKPETINYRTLKPEKDGLFDERIFGPTKDYQCYCGKYKTVRFKGVICDKCGVEVTQSRVRRERMGHISLAVPCVHTWFFKRSPHILSQLLDIGPQDLEAVIYSADYLVVAVDEEKKAKALQDMDGKFKEKNSALQKETAERIKELKKELNEKIEKIVKKKTGNAEARKNKETRKPANAENAEVCPPTASPLGEGGREFAETRKRTAVARESVELKIDELRREYQKQVLFLRDELTSAQGELETSFSEIRTTLENLARGQVLS
ncbi:MAG: DNA-directed RNA polymerase subunit beta', partial [Candidatus Cloacimonetes bacterium]|nr:DNA-directed RNA polymerase subunit beta' [Candidatus Cloacimonadota bacterium]